MNNNDVGSVIALLVLFVAAWVIIFLIFRAIVLWYWRVNRIVELLESIEEKLGDRGRREDR